MIVLTAFPSEITGNVATLGYLLGAICLVAVAAGLFFLYRMSRAHNRER